MPIFDYECDVCGRTEDYLFTIEGRVDVVDCRCGGKQHRKISKPGWVWAPTRMGQ